MIDYDSGNRLGTATPADSPQPDAAAYPASNDGLLWLRQRDWHDLQRLISQAYQHQGYKVLPLPHVGGGFDLLLTRPGERLFAQCKYWRKPVIGSAEVQEANRQAAAHHATWGVVLTSGGFTAESRHYVRQARLTLLDGPAVAQLVALGRDPDPTSASPRPALSPVPPPHLAPHRRPHGGLRAMARFAAGAASAVLALAGVAVGASVITTTITNMGNIPIAPGAVVPFGDEPKGIALDAKNGLLYTANHDSGDVTVISTKTLQPLKNIDVPGAPVALAIDTAKHRLFVADGNAAKVYVIDLVTGAKKATIATSATPTAIAVDAANRHLIVASKPERSVEFYSTAGYRRVQSAPLSAQPLSIAVDSAADRIYLLSNQLVTILDASSLRRLGSIPVTKATHVTIDAKRDLLYLTTTHGVQEHRIATGEERALKLPGSPQPICIDPATRVAYLADPVTNKVRKIRVS